VQVNSQNCSKKVWVLGTGGTIAGMAQKASDNMGYTAGQVGVDALLSAIPGLPDLLAEHELLSEQVAQIDSKDMRFDIWRTLAQRVAFHLGQSDVTAVVITHGTDTLEETAYFLHAVLPPALLNEKPVVLTCAMRPASAQNPDGPQNLMDSVTVALTSGAHGVVVVCAATVHTALEVQKAQTYRLDAFTSGDAGPLAYVEEGRLRLLRNWPLAPVESVYSAIENVAEVGLWPRVEIVMSYAGCTGGVVDALLRQAQDDEALDGLVVAATGNGTIHQELEAALRRAVQAGVKVVRSTRCAYGQVLASGHSEFEYFAGLSPVKTRIALMLELMR
jgi:L-asparaginase